MHRIALAAPLALILAGCVSPPLGDTTARPSTPGRTALSIIGTPFLIAFKIPACAATIGMAAPLGAAGQLAYTRQGAELNDALSDGLEINCGPPWAIAP